MDDHEPAEINPASGGLTAPTKFFPRANRYDTKHRNYWSANRLSDHERCAENKGFIPFTNSRDFARASIPGCGPTWRRANHSTIV
jgi:hypothetical protein